MTIFQNLLKSINFFSTLHNWVKPGAGRNRPVSVPAASVAPASNDRRLGDRRRNDRRGESRRDRAAAGPKLSPMPGWDVAGALKRLGGNVSLYDKISRQFLQGQEKTAAEYRQAVQDGDTERMARIAHTLKGLAGTIGALDLAASALNLESVLLGGGAERPEAAEAACFGELEKSLAALRAAFAEPEEPKEPAAAAQTPAGAPAEEIAAVPVFTKVPVQAAPQTASPVEGDARNALQTLIEYLRDDDAAAYSFVEQHADLLSSAMDRGGFLALRQAVAQFDFEEALRILDGTGGGNDA